MKILETDSNRNISRDGRRGFDMDMSLILKKNGTEGKEG